MVARLFRDISAVLISCVGCGALAGCGAPEQRVPTPELPIAVERPGACLGTTLASDQLDINVRTAHLRGNLRLNGQPLAPSSVARGSLVLFDTRSGSVQFVTVGTNNTGAFDVQIPLGTYEVRYVPAECAASNPMPCTPVVLERALALQADSTRNFDLTTATVSLSLTLDGQTPPALQGFVVFENAAGSSSFIRLSSVQSFAIAPDTYRVRYIGGTSSCNGPQDAWPCGQGLLAKELRIERSQPIALDVRTTLLSTVLTINGTPANVRNVPSIIELQDSSGHVQSIAYSDISNGALPPMRVVRDRYRMFWAPNEGVLCSADSNMPCDRGQLAEFDADGPTRTVTAAAQSIAVRGAVRFDGALAHMVLPSLGRGVVFALRDDKRRVSASVGTDSSYLLRLFKDTRAAIGYSTQSNGCAPLGFEGTARPCGEAIFAPSAAWNTDQTLDATLRTHTVRFAVSIDGNMVSSGGIGSFAALSLLADIPGAQVNRTTSLDAQQYRVIEGTYHIGTRNGDGGFGCDRMSSVPCGEHVIARGRSIASDGMLSVEARTRRVSGALRIGGAQPTFPQQPTSPAYVGLFTTSEKPLSAQLTTGIPATYSAQLIDAPVVGFIHSVTPCSMDEPSASAGAPAVCGLSFFTGCDAR